MHPTPTLALRLIAPLAAALAVLASAQPARADAAAGVGPSSGVYTPFGLTLGLANHGWNHAAVVGGELSVVNLTPEAVWYGGYLDVLRDVHRDAWRLSLGPELGWRIFGADLGAVAELGDAARFGVQARGLITFGTVAAYTRFGVLGQDRSLYAFSEVGVLLKYPLWIAKP